MRRVYFRCFRTKEVLIDRTGALVDDLAELRDRAVCVVRSLATARGLEDWRAWVLHVNDNRGDELFVVPFAFVLGKTKRDRHGASRISPQESNRGSRLARAAKI